MINTINDPAKPPAKRENPKKRTTLACQAVDESLPRNDVLLSDKRLLFSIRLTINIPKLRQINGIQSTKVTWTTEALTVLEKIAASMISQNPMA